MSDTLELEWIDDVAVELLDERTKFEKSFDVKENNNPIACKGIIKIVHKVQNDGLKLKIGDKIWFDARYSVEIKELKLLVVPRKNLLLGYSNDGGVCS